MKNTQSTYFVVLYTLLAIAIFSAVLVSSFWYDAEGEPVPQEDIQLIKNTANTSNTTSNKTVKKVQSTTLYPVRLTIPALDVDAKVQKVGITKAGKMATPNNFTNVGWYKYGTMPGKRGSVVMAGHVDNGLALPGVFKNLEDLRKGDDIYVEMSNGTSIHYVVNSLSVYDHNASAKNVFNQKDKNYLKLITCAGVWVPLFRTHNKRLVVTSIEV